MLCDAIHHGGNPNDAVELYTTHALYFNADYVNLKLNVFIVQYIIVDSNI